MFGCAFVYGAYISVKMFVPRNNFIFLLIGKNTLVTLWYHICLLVRLFDQVVGRLVNQVPVHDTSRAYTILWAYAVLFAFLNGPHEALQATHHNGCSQEASESPATTDPPKGCYTFYPQNVLPNLLCVKSPRIVILTYSVVPHYLLIRFHRKPFNRSPLGFEPWTSRSEVERLTTCATSTCRNHAYLPLSLF